MAVKQERDNEDDGGDSAQAITDPEYAAFIHASADDVVNHALDYVFSKDRDFQEFLKSAEAASASPSLRVRRVPQAVARNKEPAKAKKAGA